MDDIWFEDGKWCRKAKCGHVARYTNKGNCKACQKRNTMCRDCARLPENNAGYGKFGELNPFYGHRHTEALKERFSLERTGKSMPEGFGDLQRSIQGDRLRKYAEDQRGKTLEEIYGTEKALSILSKMSAASSGKNNPMYGKPAPRRAGNGWQGWYLGRFFRSLRELTFMINNPLAVTGETNYWTAQYEWNGVPRTTRPDFLLQEKLTVVECKPKKLITTPLVMAKCAALELLASTRGWQFIITDPGVVELEALTVLIADGSVQLTARTLERLEKWRS